MLNVCVYHDERKIRGGTEDWLYRGYLVVEGEYKEALKEWLHQCRVKCGRAASSTSDGCMVYRKRPMAGKKRGFFWRRNSLFLFLISLYDI